MDRQDRQDRQDPQDLLEGLVEQALQDHKDPRDLPDRPVLQDPTALKETMGPRVLEVLPVRREHQDLREEQELRVSVTTQYSHGLDYFLKGRVCGP